jgi:type II secretory pathway pseudopilin PulG
MTLVELLVVVGIIAVLSGITFSVLGPVREAARQRRCVSNLHQIGKALRMYIDDYDGVAPQKDARQSYSDLGLPALENFAAFTDQYVKNRSVLICPNYQGVFPRDQLVSSYAWSPGPDGPKPEPYQYSTVLNERGGEAPVLSCEEHNPKFDLTREPRWTLKRVIVLRLNGQVQVRQVPVRDRYPVW